MTSLDRSRYALLYGPTTGDRVRLADTDLLIEVERDLSRGPAGAGDEVVFGGGKVIGESMGQSPATRAEGAPDLVITGALILDHWGVVKADVGVRDGRITGIGKAGNPDTMSGVDPALVIGPGTEVLAGNGRILTAGGVDCHVHLIAPQQLAEALGTGITTIIAGGTGPVEGTKATTVTAGSWNLARMLESLDDFPVNVALLGKDNTVSVEALEEQLRAGAPARRRSTRPIDSPASTKRCCSRPPRWWPCCCCSSTAAPSCGSSPSWPARWPSSSRCRRPTRSPAGPGSQSPPRHRASCVSLCSEPGPTTRYCWSRATANNCASTTITATPWRRRCLVWAGRGRRAGGARRPVTLASRSWLG